MSEDSRSNILPQDDLKPVATTTASASTRTPSDKTTEWPSLPKLSTRFGAMSLILPAWTRAWKRYGFAVPSSLVWAAQKRECELRRGEFSETPRAWN